MNQTDAYYIERILKGDVNAYTSLVEKYQHMVYTLAMRMLKSKEKAEEVSQDAFVKAYTNLDSFQGKAKFSTWLYKIVYFGCLDELKKTKRSFNPEDIEKVPNIELDNTKSGLERLEDADRSQLIKDAIAKLNEDEQVILTLFYFEEQSLKELSQILDMTPNNVKVKLFRARKKMAELLKNVIEPNTLNAI